MRHINTIQNYLLVAYVFTSVFASYASLNNISNAFLILFFASSLLLVKRGGYSRVFTMYSLFAAICVGSQIYYLMIGEFEYTPEYLTIPTIFLLMLGVERVRIKYTFKTFVLINTALLPILFLAGGFSTRGGRIFSEVLSPNLQGMLVFFGFMVSAQKLIDRKYSSFSLVIFVSTAMFLAMTGSRSSLLMLMVGLLFIAGRVFQQGHMMGRGNKFKKIALSLVFSVLAAVFIGLSYQSLEKRFGEGYSIVNQAVALRKNSDSEASMGERLSFLFTSFEVVKSYPLGVGYGNTQQAMYRYGDKRYEQTANAHSVAAQMIFAVGYLGIFIYLFILWRLQRVLKRTGMFNEYGYVIAFLLLGFFMLPLVTFKVLWVLVLVLEKELMEYQGST